MNRRRTYIGGWEDMEVLFSGSIDGRVTGEHRFTRKADLDKEVLLVLGNNNLRSSNSGSISNVIHNIVTKETFNGRQSINLMRLIAKSSLGFYNVFNESIYGFELFPDKISLSSEYSVSIDIVILAIPLTEY